MTPPLTRASLVALLAVLMTVLFGGCTRRPVIPLHIGTPAEAEPAGDAVQALTIAVVPFQDRRARDHRLGVRTPLWGDTQEFHAKNGDIGRLAAHLMAHVLRANGWRAVVTDEAGDQPEADVVLTGEVQELTVDAEGRFWETMISAQSKIMVQALNRADGSKVRQTLTGVGSQGAFWFAPEDAETVVNDILLDSCAKLLATTAADGSVLRLK